MNVIDYAMFNMCHFNKPIDTSLQLCDCTFLAITPSLIIITYVIG